MRIPALLSINPELQRNLWLELTWTRLAAMPAALIVLLGGVYTVGGAVTAAQATHLALGALLLFWGSRLAAESFGDEVSNRTWDVQRLAAVSPWGLTIGKLGGGTSYVWFGAALCVAALVAFEPSSAVFDAQRFVVGGLTGQATALLLVLVVHQFGAASRRGYTTLAQLVGFGAGWETAAFGAAAAGSRLSDTVWWYGLPLPTAGFMLVLQLIFVVWLWVGVMRSIRRELGYLDGPLGWIGFNAYAVFVAAGFAVGATGPLDRGSAVVASAAAVSGLLMYAALLVTPAESTTLKRLQAGIRQRQWQKAWRDLPMWLPSGIATAVLALVLAASLAARTESPIPWSLPVAALGFAVRDIGLVYLVRLTYRRRTTLGLLILFGLLYGLAPQLFDHALFAIPRSLFVPSLSAEDGAIPGLVLPWIEAALVLASLWQKLRSLRPASGGRSV